MKAIIAGGRNYTLNSNQYVTLLKIFRKHGVSHVISGGASGVDKCGEAFAKRYGYKLSIYLPDWNKYGKSAGPIRNGLMSQIADICILFPGGAGTENMRECAEFRGLIVYEIDNNGIFPVKES